MPSETCILTAKDFAILEGLRDACLGTEDALMPVLRRKIDNALVVFREDVPENVATLGSRVTFSVDGRDPETRVLSHDHMADMAGSFLPIVTAQGLALLGLSEGQDILIAGDDGLQRIALRKVLHQPEAARREREAVKAGPAPAARAARAPALTVIRGSRSDHPARVPMQPGPFDDPGPSAA